MGVYRHLQNGDTTERSKKLKDHHMAGKIIISPLALFGVTEIGKNADLLETLQSSNSESFLAVVACEITPNNSWQPSTLLY